MPGKIIPCALCQLEAAAVYCVNDDAHLCGACDASVHAANPLLGRHERRPLTALTCQAECASAACGPAASAATTDADVGVVPQLLATEQEELQPAAPPAAPLDLFEDSFFGRQLSASDLLDLDSDELELPGSSPFSFDPLVDCVVPSFEDELRAPAPAHGFFPAAPLQQAPAFVPQQQPAYLSPYMRAQQPRALAPTAGKPYTVPQQRTPEEEAEEAARVARHRERQRKKRNFGRAVRYQSRRAYAEIRPRIKGRFVTPEEYAAYEAQQAAQKAGVPYVPAYSLPPAPVEEDAVVPVPSFA